ncbi:MAG: hypothetical protein V2A56_02145, partial [bacterium]
MRKTLFFSLPLIVVLLLSQGAAAASEYYVNPGTGQDITVSGWGLSSDTSWKSITYAIQRIDALNTTDNILHLAAGEYKWNVAGGAETAYPIAIPSALQHLQIIGAGEGSTILKPTGHQMWDVQYVFDADGLYSLKVSDLSITNGRGLLYAHNMTSTPVPPESPDSLIVERVSGANYDLSGSSTKLPPVRINSVSRPVRLSYFTFDGSRCDVSGGGGVVLITNVSKNVTINHFTATSTTTPWYKGGAIYASGITGASSSLIIEDIHLSDTYAGEDGGAIYIGRVDGPLTIRNGTIINAYTEWGSGGAIAITDARSTITIAQVSVDGSRAFQDGGAISIDNVRDDLTITDCDILNNSTVYGKGGGVSIENLKEDNLTITVSNSIFDGNSNDTGDGGALQIDGGQASGETLVLDNLVVKNNSAGDWGNGGGIAVTDIDAVSLTNSTIRDNEIDSNGDWYDGGGMYVENVVDLNVDNVAFIGNVAQGSGGGLAVVNQGNTNESQTLHQVAFIDNVAEGTVWSGNGGGYYTTQADNVTIEYVLFAGNYAAGDGGAIDYDRAGSSSSLTISSVTMAYNEAAGNGDAIYNEQTILGGFDIENSIIWANGDTSRTADPDMLSTQDAIAGSLNKLDTEYSNIQTSDTTGYGAENNTNVDPFFSDPTVNDFSVLPGSPMLDTGNPISDTSQEPQPNNNIINIGYTPPTTVDPVTGQIVTAPVGSPADPVTVGTVTAASLASTKSFRNKYMMMGSPVVPDSTKHYADPDSAWGDD